VNISYSEEASKKEKEEDIVYNFTNFCESLDVTAYNHSTILIEEDCEVEDTFVALVELIRFCSGSNFILDSMKSKGTIKFIYPGEESFGQRLEARTCFLSLEFPVSDRYCGSPEDFVKNFCEDIISSPGFGKK